MQYRDIEYSIAQSLDVGTWKWTSSLDQKTRTISAKSRKDAVEAVHKLIDKTVAPKKQYLKPGRRD
jgi:hypothetical protein